MEAPRLLAPQPLLPLLLLLLGLASATGGAWRPEDSDGTQCLGVAGSNGNSTTCLPSWMATWDMKRSTVLYTCNNTGMHNVTHAVDYGTVVYDWSNAKLIWANNHPMNSDELLTKQAELVLDVDPSLEGYAPRVWTYRNSIKALNWYTSVRTKLDDPKYKSWFVKFKGFDGKIYPGGAGKASNGSFNVPVCDWYGAAAKPAKCSGFYHDEEQTPEKAVTVGGASMKDYPVDGECVEQCDCGATNPCAEYVFNNSGGVVEGRSFTRWFVDEYMVTNETLLHRNPRTGKPQAIGLGWLDDSMTPTGPTEEDRHYMADTGADAADMKTQVDAYRATMTALVKKVLPMGGFWWQLMDNTGNRLAGHNATVAQCKQVLADCKQVLADVCKPTPEFWNRMGMYVINGGGPAHQGLSEADLTQFTAEFLLTRGPYAMIGYGWYGCTGSANHGPANIPYPGYHVRDPPRAREWDMDLGEPTGACNETGSDTGIFSRDWGKAAVTWDCNKGAGDIAMKAGFESEHTNPTKAGKGAWEIEYAAAAAAAAAASEERQLR